MTTTKLKAIETTKLKAIDSELDKLAVVVERLQRRIQALESALESVEHRVRLLLNEAADRATERIERSTVRPPPPPKEGGGG
jgi:phage shock protein A